MFVTILSVSLAASFFCSATSLAKDTWVPVKDVSLMVEEGSILDLSVLVPPAKPINTRLIVNNQGHWALENQPDKMQRFLIGSLGFGVGTGSFPSHAITDLYVQQFRLHGYNMARLDFVEATLMEGRRKDFDGRTKTQWYLFHAEWFKQR